MYDSYACVFCRPHALAARLLSSQTHAASSQLDSVRVIIRSDLFIYCIAYCRLVYITVSGSVYRYIVAIISCGRYLFNLLCPKYIMVLVTAILLLVA